MADPKTSLPPRGERAVTGAAKPKKSKSLSFFKLVLILMLAALLGLIGYGAWLWFQIDGAIDRVGTPEAVAPEERASERPISMLILGIDYREQLRSANTDVIMLASLNPNSKTATLVSIPRDTYIDPDGLRANKANSFYSTYLYGSLSEAPKDRDERELYAMAKIKELYSDFLDVPLDYVTIVDFKAFVDVVDAYGGLTIDVDQNMCHRDYADGTNINLKAGTQELNGQQTLDFVRYRLSMNCSPKTKVSSDFERNERQQQVMSKLFDKMKSMQGAMKIGGVFDAVANNVKTDIPSQQIQNMMQTYITINNDKIDYIHLEGSWDGRYVRLSEEDVTSASTALQEQLLPDGPPAAEAAADAEGASPDESESESAS